MDKQQKIYARKGLVFPNNQERDRVEGKRTGQEQGPLQAGGAAREGGQVTCGSSRSLMIV